MKDNFWGHIELILITYDQSESPASKVNNLLSNLEHLCE